MLGLWSNNDGTTTVFYALDRKIPSDLMSQLESKDSFAAMARRPAKRPKFQTPSGARLVNCAL
ncbi:hypothetical protein MW887_001808 [Aspergillus wentii]|nr:hypothetical protein MW887_001808 [Aspergillus wentii]